MTITALPSWLRHDDEFSRLIKATDGYVLQVHSLEPPRRPDAEILLCDPEAAQRWVESASRFGRPFRVALPTYGYVVAFGSGSEIVGVSAEGPRPSWPRDAAIRVARSDPDAMARLVRNWTEDRPAELAGLIWYRLPAAGDRLNWPWPAFRAVLEGRAPRRELQTVRREPEPGLIEIDLVNAGETEMPWPSPVDFRWKEGEMLAADGLAGYQVHPAGPRGIRLQRGASAWDRPLRPGERRMVAWLRLGVP